MNVAVLIATFGDRTWLDLARERAEPSVVRATSGHLPAGVALSGHVHLPHGTIAQARNQAAENATVDWTLGLPPHHEARLGPDWFCFVDADDELDPGYIAAMETAAEALAGLGKLGGALLVPARQEVMPGGMRTNPEIPNTGRRGVRPLIDINRAVVGTLVPRTLFERVGGFHEGFEPYEDWELWLRCVRAGARLVHVPAAVYVAHANPGSAHLDPEGHFARVGTYNRIRALHAGDGPEGVNPTPA